MAAGNRSAKLKAYYAEIGNKFWSTIFDIGLIPDKISYRDFHKLINIGIGLTDLVKDLSGNDSAIIPTEKDIKILIDKIELYKPAILAFNGKAAANYCLGWDIDYGLQKACIGQTRIFVLPTTSLNAFQYWDVEYWQELAKIVAGYSE